LIQGQHKTWFKKAFLAALRKGGRMSNTDPDDLLWGAGEIGKAIRRTDRQVYHLLTGGQLPARKIGGSWVASRRELFAALTGDDGAAS
jgi:hypothetical protein